MAEELRLLRLDGVSYRYRVTQRRTTAQDPQPRLVTKFMAYREGTSGAALRMSFADGPCGHLGYVYRRGVVFLKTPDLELNLNRPAVAAALLRRAMASGWSADGPMEVLDGFSFLADLPEDELHRLAGDDVHEAGTSTGTSMGP